LQKYFKWEHIMKSFRNQFIVAAFFAASAAGALASADTSCQAQMLNGKWNCSGKTVEFDVSENQGIYQLNPNSTQAFAIPLDGQSHTFSESGITVETTGTCQGSVITVSGTNNGLIDFSQQFTIESAKKLGLVVNMGGQNYSATCSKE